MTLPIMYRTAAGRTYGNVTAFRSASKAAQEAAAQEDERRRRLKKLEENQRRKRLRQIAGFKNFGEQMRAILSHRRDGGRPDDRLVRAPQGASEGAPSDGGFLVPTSYANELVGLMYEKSRVAQFCTQLPSSNLADLRVPAIDETSRADGSRYGGVMSYWLSEAETLTASLPRFRQLRFSAKKIVVLCWGTNEMVEDASMLGAHLMRAASAELAFQLDRAVVRGSAGKPLGVLNAPCLITVGKGSTGAASIGLANIAEMYSRLPLESQESPSTRWLCHADCINQFNKLEFASTDTTTQLTPAAHVFIPRMVAGNPQPLLMGIPVVTMEQCLAVGTVGDIILGDFSRYFLLDGGVKPTVSADVAFLSGQTIFKFVLRVDGMPEFASAVTPFSGSNTVSPFIALETRT